MTTENSRADALTIIEDARDGNWYEFAVNGHHGLIRVVARREDDDLDYPLGKKVRDFLLAASPVEQPATAPIVSTPADERAAFDLTDMEWLKVFERVCVSIPNVFGSYVKASAAFAREAIRMSEEARAASASETGADDLTHLTDEQIEKSREAVREWWARRDALQPAPSPADERAALSTDGYFVYDPAGPHVEFYDTDAERDAAHRDAINEYRREATLDQEWPTEVVGIVSGIVTHTTDELKVDEDSYDYEPRAVRSHARAASASETGAQGAPIPAGYALVPIEPTPEIMTAIWQNERDSRRAWERAIAMVPQPPAQADARVGLTDARIARLRAAIEGECDGLHVDYHHAKAILAYLDDDRA
ncbi:gp58 [Burkholderia phage Bcep43]|uniref:Gp58 n=1 Tax=Burkholderia phage Bcep43 TaxID=2883945 RepID=Q6UK92_9CAUD|nr:gp58 [Burkholderia phage Bcep43]AAR89350.1 gp58 [Burkholderia phage Bcep43]